MFDIWIQRHQSEFFKMNQSEFFKMTQSENCRKRLVSLEVRQEPIIEKQSEIWILHFQTCSQFLKLDFLLINRFIVKIGFINNYCQVVNMYSSGNCQWWSFVKDHFKCISTLYLFSKTHWNENVLHIEMVRNLNWF